MIEYFQNRLTLSEKEAKDLRRGITFSALLNLTLMLPPSYLFLFLMEYLKADSRIGRYTLQFYVLSAVVPMYVMFFTNRWQYDSAYAAIYNESAQRRISLAGKLRRLPLAFFGEQNLSDLTSTIVEDCTSLEQIFSYAVPQLFASVLSMLITTISLFFYDWQLATALFWVTPLTLVALLLAKCMVDRSSEQSYHIKRSVTEQVQGRLECIQEIKLYNSEAEYDRGFDDHLKTYERESVNDKLVTGSFVNLPAVLLKLGVPTVIVAGTWMLQHGGVSIFVYLASLLISAMVYSLVQDVCSNLAILALLDVYINRMKGMEVMPEQKGNKDVVVNNYDIESRNVSLAYETEKRVLYNVSFTIKQGKVTALAGPSEGGRSTTAKLIACFWDIDSGKTLLSGNDVAHTDPETLLRSYTVVFQDVLLFDASVADNTHIGKCNATDEEVRCVARLTQCDDFISRISNGYNTIIGENGKILSDGERQRISTARAPLKDAPVILLDEATASLGTENKTKIQAGISELVQGKTVTIIAHRMRTVRNADHIVVLGGGAVIERGAPEDLMAKSGEFARMVRLRQEDNSKK